MTAEENMFGSRYLRVPGGSIRMSTGTEDHHDHDVDADRVHDNSWSANLEGPEHAEDRDFLVAQALSAVSHTAPGNHVNLVTHGAHGHPETYLYDALSKAYGDEVAWEYVDQCGCGGHVVRVRT
jgi:putative CGCGG family rSAM target protein